MHLLGQIICPLLLMTKIGLKYTLWAGQIVLPPSPHGQPRGQTENVCDKKGRGTGKKSDYSVYIGRGKGKIM